MNKSNGMSKSLEDAYINWMSYSSRDHFEVLKSAMQKEMQSRKLSPLLEKQYSSALKGKKRDIIKAFLDINKVEAYLEGVIDGFLGEGSKYKTFHDKVRI